MAETVKTQERTSRRLALGLWLFALGFTVWQFWPVISPVTGRDFTIFWLAGKVTLAGHPEIAYDPVAFAEYSQKVAGKLQAPLPYPPSILLLFAPLGLFPITAAYFIWNAVSAGLFAWAARPYMRNWASIMAVLTPAGCLSMQFGQTGLFIGALWLIAFQGYPWAVALLTLKPHTGWMAAFTLNSPRKFIVACAVGLALLGVTAILFPAAVSAFPEALARQFSYIDSKKYEIWYFQIVSPRFVYGLTGWLLFAIAAIVLVWRRFDVFTAATASMLISPYALHYDMPVACLGMILALRREQRPIFQFLLMFGYATPYLIMTGSTWFAPPLILGALYAQVFGPPVGAELRRRAHANGQKGGEVTDTRMSSGHPVRW